MIVASSPGTVYFRKTCLAGFHDISIDGLDMALHCRPTLIDRGQLQEA
jgi:hypothetical protein